MKKGRSLQLNQISRQNTLSVERIAQKLIQLQAKTTQNLDKFTLRKVQASLSKKSDVIVDSLEAWTESYLQLAVVVVRSEALFRKIALHLR